MCCMHTLLPQTRQLPVLLPLIYLQQSGTNIASLIVACFTLKLPGKYIVVF